MLLKSVTAVYNVSVPLALVLIVPAFLIYGKFRRSSIWKPWTWSLTVDLDSLAQLGTLKIAHLGSLVHPNEPSHRPDPILVQNVVDQATRGQSLEGGQTSSGLSISDLARIRVEREAEAYPYAKTGMSLLHREIALGESSLLWLIFRDGDTVPVERIEQWLGEERLPDRWWDIARPQDTVGLLEARRRAKEIGKETDTMRKETSVLQLSS